MKVESMVSLCLEGLELDVNDADWAMREASLEMQAVLLESFRKVMAE
jgi:hypothetical protein